MKIAAAAVRVLGKIYIGSTHFEATMKFIHLPDMAEAKTEDGYVTNTGRFVDREEAFKIAVSNGQAHGELANPQANMNFYGTHQPRLDSSSVENYAMFSVPTDFI